MLHEILLSLSGHPSPLLSDNPELQALSTISPPERELLASVAHLSDLHVKLLGYTAQISASHLSTICRAVATAIDSVHLAAFQRKVLEVEESILRKDAALVGAYNIVPLTAVVGEFSDWTRRMEWLWDIVQFMLKKQQDHACRGSQLIDKLRTELLSGYADVERTALSLVSSAEMAWLKQVSAWILYGRLPSFGGEDFFIQRADDDDQQYVSVPSLMPSFVTPSTAATMLFIGKSLNHVRVKNSIESGSGGLDHLRSQLEELSALTYPLNSAVFSRKMAAIRQSLSRTTLRKLLPLDKIVEILRLFRDFFLLGRGEFAIVLTHEADEKIRSRWKRADNLAYEKRDGLATVVVKEGEVAGVLGRTWAAMGSMQGQHADEDEGLELARNLLRLNLLKSKPATPIHLGATTSRHLSNTLATTPFCNLLFSVPVVLTLNIPSPLDMFLTSSDLQIYTAINSYLLSIRRVHIRLTELWKVTTLRRHHPAPPGPPLGSTRGGRAQVTMLRERYAARFSAMRSAWVTSSAAVFFLAETEAYLQTEVVAGLWDGFHAWLVSGGVSAEGTHNRSVSSPSLLDRGKDEDIWLAAETQNDPTSSDTSNSIRQSLPREQHDPQTMSTAHQLFLRALSRRLLLTQTTYTDPLYNLLVHLDHLVALIYRLHGIWASMDLESDAGVVDAFVDLENEEAEVKRALRSVEEKVKLGVEEVISVLRTLEMDSAFMAQMEDDAELGDDGDGMLREEGQYVPRRVGGIDRLLMKLDFGVWFGSGQTNDD